MERHNGMKPTYETTLTVSPRRLDATWHAIIDASEGRGWMP